MFRRITIIASILLILLIVPLSSFSQSEELQLVIQNSKYGELIDFDYIELILDIEKEYINRTPKEIREDVTLLEHRTEFYAKRLRQLLIKRRYSNKALKLNFLNSYFTYLQLYNHTNQLQDFLQRPSINDLLCIILIHKLGAYKQNYYKEYEMTEEEIVIEAVESLHNEIDWLKFYFVNIVYSVDKNPAQVINVNLYKTGLNMEEQSIVYLELLTRNSVSIIGRCGHKKKKSAINLLNQIPTFNGEHFSKFKPYRFDDVTMELYDKLLQCYYDIKHN